MNKPAQYDSSETKAISTSVKPTGSHVCKIVHVLELTSSNKRPMLILFLDISEGEHTSYFTNLYKHLQKRNSHARWPCIHRRCCDGDQVPYLKGDIKAIEASNHGFVYKWGDSSIFKDKTVGVLFGEKEITPDGSKTIVEPRWLVPADLARKGTLKPPRIQKYTYEDDSQFPSYSSRR